MYLRLFSDKQIFVFIASFIPAHDSFLNKLDKGECFSFGRFVLICQVHSSKNLKAWCSSKKHFFKEF